jgi:hypothetical protein
VAEQGRWNLTVSLHGREAWWAMAPAGYLPVADVRRVMCGGTDAAPTVIKERDFVCVEP